MNKRPYLFCIFLSTFLSVFSQDYNFDVISVEDGLSQSSVTCITQDDKGFVWIGTRDGLNRFDGYDVEVFRKIPFDSTSLMSNSINSLLAEPEGLWVATNEGLQWYEWSTKRFQTIKLTEYDKTLSITSIFQDNFGVIWIATSTGFFSVRRDIVYNDFVTKSYSHNQWEDPNDTITFGVSNFLHDSKNRFWIASSSGLFQLNFDSNQNLVIQEDLRLLPKKHLKDRRRCQDLIEYSDGDIYLSAANEIDIYNAEEDKFSSIFKIDLENRTNANILQLSEFPDSQLVASTNVGLQFIKLKKEKIESSDFLYLPSNGNSEIRHKINYVYCDNVYDDLYWLATDIGGVVKMHRKHNNFKTQFLKDIPSLRLDNPYLRHIVADENHIWYNLGRMVVVENRAEHKFQIFRNIYPPAEKLSNTSISFLFRSREGNILAGLTNELKELWIDNQGRQRSKSFKLKSHCLNKVNSIFETEQHYIIGGLNGHVTIIEKEGFREITCLNASEFFDKNDSKEISSILMDSESNLWLGTSNGLILYPDYNINKGPNSEPKYFYYDRLDTSSLIENKITHLMEDSKHNVWICTRNGLMYTNILSKKIELQRVETEALQQQVIYGILEDNQNECLWMSSNAGLFTYNPTTKKIDQFNIKDGLQGNEFNTFSFFKSKTGEMFFGGPKGLTYFNPENIRLNNQGPPVWLTELETLNGENTDLITFDKEQTLFLDYKHRTFSIQFIGLDYFYPDEVQYYYKLQGETESQESSLGNSKQLNFSQLRPDSYSLQITAINKHGILSEKGDKLNFTIRAPFWKMMWFYLLITTVIIGLFWLLFYLRYRSKMKQLDAIETVRKSIAEDFHDEMGSKLSIISMYSEFTKNELADQGGKAAVYIDKVNTTAARLYDNTRDLIWVLNPQNDTLHDLYLQLKDFGDELLKDTTINFHSSGISEHLKNEKLPVRYKRHLLLIFKEAMHNSLKHSSCKNIRLSISQEKEGLTFTMQDDGDGFNTEIAHKGDGMKNMQQRAKQIDSELHCESNDKGTRIWLSIQKSKT